MTVVTIFKLSEDQRYKERVGTFSDAIKYEGQHSANRITARAAEHGAEVYVMRGTGALYVKVDGDPLASFYLDIGHHFYVDKHGNVGGARPDMVEVFE